MATGKVIAPNIVKDSVGRTIIDVRVGTDRVEGNGTSTITRVWRNNVVKFSGWGYMTWDGYVQIDGVVEPPPVDPNPTVTLTHTIQVYSDGSIRVDGIAFP